MKKILLGVIAFLLLSLTFISCSDDEGLYGTPPNLADSKNSPYRVNIEFASASENHELENLQVGDFVKFKYSISLKNGEEIPEDISFKFAPYGGNQEYHQIINTDYELYEEDPENSDSPIPVNEINANETTGYFWIKILQAGSFNLIYNLNYSSGSFAGKFEINFNAVRIAAFRYYYVTDRSFTGPTTPVPEHDYCHVLYIDNGIQKHDSYLNDLAFSVYFDGEETNFTQFVPRENFMFFDKQTFTGFELTQIKIFDKIDSISFADNTNAEDGSPAKTIVYKNIIVADEGKQNDWKDAVNVNL